jgi:hypothetical protein
MDSRRAEQILYGGLVPVGGGMKEDDGEVNSIIIYLIYFKNFSKCHNVLPGQQ